MEQKKKQVPKAVLEAIRASTAFTRTLAEHYGLSWAEVQRIRSGDPCNPGDVSSTT